MRMLYIATARIPTEKAHGFQIMKTIEALIELGTDVTLLLPKRRNHITEPIEKYYDLTLLPRIVWVPNIFGWLEGVWHRGYFSLLRALFGVVAFLYGLFARTDVIYTRQLGIACALSLAGKRVVYEDHEPKRHHQWLYRWCIRHIWKKVIVAGNLSTLYTTWQIDPKSVKHIPNGVDLEAFDHVSADSAIWSREMGIEKGERIVLYTGHFYAWKGVYTLIDAAALLQATVVLIGGTAEDRSAVETYIAEKQLRNVRIHPFVDHARIIVFLKSADVLVLPNTAEEERSARYNTPIKLFEYMAANVPIVASRIPSFSAYLEDQKNALLALPDDPRDLAKRIQQILDTPTLGQQLSEHAYVLVKQWTWKNRAERIIGFING